MDNRIITTLSFVGLAAVVAVTTLPAHAQSSTVIIAPTAPPPERMEVIPRPPARVMTWQPGRWAWAGGTWQWIDGRYIEAPHPDAIWEPGHWEQYPSGGYNWVEGHWRG